MAEVHAKTFFSQPPQLKESEMHTETTRTQQKQNEPRRTKTPFELDIEARMDRANGERGRWLFILDTLEENQFAPASLSYEFVNRCPHALGEMNLRLEMVMRYRNFVNRIDFDKGDPSKVIARLRVLMLLCSHYSCGEFLKQKTLVIEAFKNLNMKIPQGLLERIAQCDRHQKEHNGYTEQEFSYAGYKRGVANSKVAWIHPDTGDTIVVGTQKLTGGALLSPEEQEQHRLANIALRNEGRAKRLANKANKPQKVKAEKKATTKKGEKRK